QERVRVQGCARAPDHRDVRTVRVAYRPDGAGDEGGPEAVFVSPLAPRGLQLTPGEGRGRIQTRGEPATQAGAHVGTQRGAIVTRLLDDARLVQIPAGYKCGEGRTARAHTDVHVAHRSGPGDLVEPVDPVPQCCRVAIDLRDVFGRRLSPLLESNAILDRLFAELGELPGIHQVGSPALGNALRARVAGHLDPRPCALAAFRRDEHHPVGAA